MFWNYYLSVLSFVLFCAGCKSDQNADLIITNANLYAVDTIYQGATAIAVKDGIIISIGSDDEIRKLAGKDAKEINGQGNFVMPGFIE
ncbi:MAG: amidohydrolase, partial [Saprospiraceae bacterium]|nr:amidohydrolase [Saprospiraceae bacterium]